jgi:5-enolpyruvylshikimate-3-phosphate synthase
VLAAADRDGLIDSRDHRVVQAVVMRRVLAGQSFRVTEPSVVSKSWPRFFEFVSAVAGKPN